jgi:hypothetical protein
MANYIEKICKLSGVVWKQYNSLQRCNCDECKKLIPKKVYVPRKFNTNLKLKSLNPIPKVSKKRQIENAKYSVLRIEFLGKIENRICPITKQPTTDIHHKKGRIGSLLLDTRYWIALSREGHKFVEENPEWAKENGYSLNRLTNE